ncbi:enediyne biosynthesis protein UnbU [Streptosporangium sp. NPDC050855]|uniref:enediyne biosynthesis protein UnbU n=1 Tax=Streptosporangium sp. NPDC050855 TaxID=3366194 RepID=UPI0037B5FD45
MRTGRATPEPAGTYRNRPGATGTATATTPAGRDGRDGRGGRRRGRASRWAAASLTLLTVLGHTVLGFEQPWSAPVAGALTGVVAALVLETVEAWAWRRPVRYLGVPGARVLDLLLPSYVCGLLCAMLLYGGGSPMPVVLAVLVGVGSGYLPRRPFLNPVATGVAAALLLLPQVSLAPSHQFTAWVSGPFDLIVPSAVLAAGVVHAWLARRLPLLLGWVAGFAAQALVRGWLTDVSTVAALLPMTGTAFALYAGYVIADPVTSPARPREQAGFGLAAAAVYGLLVQWHVVFGPFLALVAVCAGRELGPLLPARLLPSPRFVPSLSRPSAGTPDADVPGRGVSRSPGRPAPAPAANPPGGPP